MDGSARQKTSQNGRRHMRLSGRRRKMENVDFPSPCIWHGRKEESLRSSIWKGGWHAMIRSDAQRGYMTGVSLPLLTLTLVPVGNTYLSFMKFVFMERADFALLEAIEFSLTSLQTPERAAVASSSRLHSRAGLAI